MAGLLREARVEQPLGALGAAVRALDRGDQMQ
jgi:hypothetical protein